jgi:arginine/lysine/ornithine decarboxylase
MQENRELIKELRNNVSDFKMRLSAKNYRFFKSDDFLKLAVDFKYTGISSRYAEGFLNENNIYPELNDGRYILFYLSALTKKKELNKLEKKLKKLTKIKKFKKTFIEKPELKTGKKSFSYLVAAEMEKILYPIEKSEGKICGRNAGIFPPCFPIVIAGEIITKETIDLLKNQTNVFGMKDKKIYVIK